MVYPHDVTASGSRTNPPTKHPPVHAHHHTDAAVVQDGAKADERAMWCIHMMSLPVARIIPLLYPRLLAFHKLMEDGGLAASGVLWFDSYIGGVVCDIGGMQGHVELTHCYAFSDITFTSSAYLSTRGCLVDLARIAALVNALIAALRGLGIFSLSIPLTACDWGNWAGLRGWGVIGLGDLLMLA